MNDYEMLDKEDDNLLISMGGLVRPCEEYGPPVHVAIDVKVLAR